MVSAKLLSSLVALTFNIGVQCQGTGSCVETITARSGDTCASLAELAGISVADFLRSNPWVSSCSTLITNGIYCKTGTAAVRPTAPIPAGVPSNSPWAPLEVSKDGTCGAAITCSGSRFGRCCSAYGFCGSSSDHCGEGCQLDFGECGDAVLSSKPTPTEQEPGTVIVTMTVSVTDTYTVRASTSIVTVTATAAIPSTATVVSTSTVRVTSTRRTRTTRASTTLVTTTTTPTSTRRVRPTTTTTKSQGPPPKPSPLLPNTPRNCKSYDLIRRGDNCQSVARRNELSLREFYDLNPSISNRRSPLGDLLCELGGGLSDLLGGKCRIGCDDLWVGYYVCTSR